MCPRYVWSVTEKSTVVADDVNSLTTTEYKLKRTLINIINLLTFLSPFYSMQYETLSIDCLECAVKFYIRLQLIVKRILTCSSVTIIGLL